MPNGHNDGLLYKDDLLTAAQVADLWQVSIRTIQRYITDGKLRAMKLPSGRYRIRRQDADAALKDAS